MTFTCTRALPDYVGKSGHVYKMRCRMVEGHEGDCIPGYLGALVAMERIRNVVVER